MTEHFAIIPARDLTPGEIDVRIRQVGDGIDSAKSDRSGISDAVAQRVVCQPFSILSSTAARRSQENGSIGREDYKLWQSQFGMMVAAGTGSDGSGDGIVNAADYVVWRNRFEAVACTGSSFVARVPEPAAGTLVMSIACSLLARRCPTTRDSVTIAA